MELEVQEELGGTGEPSNLTGFCIWDYKCAYLPDRAVRMSYKYLLKLHSHTIQS